MTPTAEDPQSEGASADLPIAPPADAASGMQQESAAEPQARTEPQARSETQAAGEPHRRRRRRRRRPPRDFAAGRDPAGIASGEATAGAETVDADPTLGDGATAPSAPTGTANATGDRSHRRRRRRRGPPFGASASAGKLTTPAPFAAGEGSASPSENMAGGEGDAGAAASGEESGRATLHLRLPVRGRRRLPHPPGLRRGTAETAPSGTASETGEATVNAPRADGEFPRRRRRRRFPPRTSEAAVGSDTAAAEGMPRDANRLRGPGRDRRPGQERSREVGQPGPDDQQGRRRAGARPRDPTAAGAARREPGSRERRAQGRGGARDSRRNGARDAGPRRIEQKLYALEAKVDRGFEDIVDDADESGTRRVHWTIVKRSVADQKSSKSMSTTYVLQREGEETEFPNLGAARAAANKTIVHPEKLTMSKAEHAAAKNSK